MYNPYNLTKDGKVIYIHYYKDGKYLDHNRYMTEYNLTEGSIHNPFPNVNWKIKKVEFTYIDYIIHVHVEDNNG